jgi:Zn finger protein HypA/HybF involved in hydrogenase expression
MKYELLKKRVAQFIDATNTHEIEITCKNENTGFQNGLLLAQRLMHELDKEFSWQNSTINFKCPACENNIDIEQQEDFYIAPIKCSCGYKGKFATTHQ